MGIYKDDRKPEESETHTVIVSGIDKCLSGWGDAKGGKSVAAWACREADADRVFSWVKARGDIKLVRMSDHAFRSGAVHTHIYCVRDGHPALGGASNV